MLQESDFETMLALSLEQAALEAMPSEERGSNSTGPLHSGPAAPPAMADDWFGPVPHSQRSSLTARMRVSMFSKVLLSNA